jgi:Protein of unknown function (DUF3716)
MSDVQPDVSSLISSDHVSSRFLFSKAEVAGKNIDCYGNALLHDFQSDHDKKFLTMKVLRDVDWRDLSKAVAFGKNRQRACLAQQIGVEIEIPCEHCAKGCGPFTTCVVAVFSDGSVAYEGSCAGCGSGGGANRCSFREAPPAELVEYLRENHPRCHYLIKHNLVVRADNKSSARKRKNASAPATPLKKARSGAFAAGAALSTPSPMGKQVASPRALSIKSSHTSPSVTSSVKKSTGREYDQTYYHSPLDTKNVYNCVKTGDFEAMIEACDSLQLIRKRLDDDFDRMQKTLRDNNAHPDQQIAQEEEEESDDNPFALVDDEPGSEEVQPRNKGKGVIKTSPKSPTTPSKRGRGRPAKGTRK